MLKFADVFLFFLGVIENTSTPGCGLLLRQEVFWKIEFFENFLLAFVPEGNSPVDVEEFTVSGYDTQYSWNAKDGLDVEGPFPGALLIQYSRERKTQEDAHWTA